MSKGNEPAYPAANAHRVMRDGLTKRELFAAMAMQGILADRGLTHPSSSYVAAHSVEHADALLAALEDQ